jgi:23S rRNA (uridine2552-2'-O)-methyltransferase
MAYNPKDFFFHKAKKENYVARSVFKLQEIDQRYRIFRPAMKVLDLGAAPGSWSQYASEKVGIKGKVLGIDLQPIKLTLRNSVFITADMRQLDLAQVMTDNGISPPFDLVLSDMAPKTTGIRLADQLRSLELCELALETAERFLKPGGHFVCKLFHSQEFEGLRAKIKQRFDKVASLRPESTRKESKEIFLIGLDYQPPKPPKKDAGL